MRKIGENGPLDMYFEYGDQRPPLGKLTVLYERGLAEPAHPKTLRALADMCIDLSVVDGTNAAHWLDEAEDKMNETVDMTVDLQQRGYTVDTTPAVYSILRTVELPRWHDAVFGFDPQPPDYVDMISALERALPFTKEPDGSEAESVSSVREYMPLLLGARTLAYRDRGWQGRLALAREDRRPLPVRSERNGNWDIGVQKNRTAEEFINPSEKIQIKTERAKHEVQAYLRAGVKLISAKEYGFADYEQLISNIVKELDRETSGNSGPSPISSSLDIISGKLRRAIMAPVRPSRFSSFLPWR